jgi:hypothetical protein
MSPGEPNEEPNAYRIVEVTTTFVDRASSITGVASRVEHEVQSQTRVGWSTVYSCPTLVEARCWLIMHLPDCNCWFA